MSNQVKKYDPLDRTLKFVDRQDDLDPCFSPEDDCSLRAEMSCGHAVTPDSLTGWCRSQLDQGQYEFRCPALTQGTKLCNTVWSYQEVRRMADLTAEEMEYFEKNMARLAAAKYCETQPCPLCKTNVERKNLSNLCVKCTVCSADQQKAFYFCWQCHNEWKGSNLQPARCGNISCANTVLGLLQTCKTVSLPKVEGVTCCPSIRVCPTCGVKIEHNLEHCKNIRCRCCKVEFCFVCLELKRECSKTSSPYGKCLRGVAARQTSIPVWHR